MLLPFLVNFQLILHFCNSPMLLTFVSAFSNFCSNFFPSGTCDVSSGVGNVNFYTVPSLPHEMATSRYRNKTDITFNILVRRKVLTLNRDKSMVGMATNFTFHFYLPAFDEEI